MWKLFSDCQKRWFLVFHRLVDQKTELWVEEARLWSVEVVVRGWKLRKSKYTRDFTLETGLYAHRRILKVYFCATTRRKNQIFLIACNKEKMILRIPGPVLIDEVPAVHYSISTEETLGVASEAC